MTNKRETKIFDMPLSSVYPLYIQKVEKKGRTKEEVDHVICWLTGYDYESLSSAVGNHISFRDFFANAPLINPSVRFISGSICGVKIENIADPLMKNIRYLDKLIDEIAKGKPMDKVLRNG